MIHLNQKNNEGFIALISAIIISIILLLIITNLSLTGFYNRFNILDSELKERSSALAEACADTAILNLAQGINFTGEVSIDGEKCNIESISGSTEKTIVVEAKYKNYFTNLRVVVKTSDLSVVSWEETPN
jgi:uncharacterized membrane protein